MNLRILLSQSLKTRVTLFTLAIFVISIWSLAYFSSRMLHVDMERLSGEQQFSTVSFIAAEVNQGLEDRVQALELIARAIDPVLLANAGSLQKFLDHRYVLHSMFNAGVIALSADGTAIADTSHLTGRIGTGFMDRDFVFGALKDGKATIGRPVVGRHLQAPIFGMAAPIRDPKGNVIGALAGVTSLNMPNFLDRIANSRYGKTGGYLLVAPRYRLVVTASDKNRIMEQLPAAGVNPLLDRFIQGYEGSDVFVNPFGVEVLASAKGIPLAGWYVAVSLPTVEAFAPIHAVQRRMLIATILLTLLAGGLTWWMLSRQLAPMLATVKTLAAASDASQPPKPLHVARQDEAGQLIGAFNRVLATLTQREEALQASENRFRTLVDWAPEPFFVHRGGTLLYVNPAAIKLFGATSAQELVGKPLLELIHPDCHSCWHAMHWLLGQRADDRNGRR
ncbi:MAG: PAS domain-containing protein [Betaproteobacteria bacterium]|nr:PAS domain-containing protein [Betaproteobacteria bacterium]